MEHDPTDSCASAIDTDAGSLRLCLHGTMKCRYASPPELAGGNMIEVRLTEVLILAN
jgi:hypothetical protein